MCPGGLGVIWHSPCGIDYPQAKFFCHYMDFAQHYGFKIVPCNVGKGNEKGVVENGVGYVKKNLLNSLSIPNFKIMEPVAQNWLDTIANVRTHRETGKRPVDMFHEEKSSLQPKEKKPGIKRYSCGF